jgi:hypothetical protein
MGRPHQQHHGDMLPCQQHAGEQAGKDQTHVGQTGCQASKTKGCCTCASNLGLSFECQQDGQEVRRSQHLGLLLLHCAAAPHLGIPRSQERIPQPPDPFVHPLSHICSLPTHGTSHHFTAGPKCPCLLSHFKIIVSSYNMPPKFPCYSLASVIPLFLSLSIRVSISARM